MDNLLLLFLVNAIDQSDGPGSLESSGSTAGSGLVSTTGAAEGSGFSSALGSALSVFVSITEDSVSIPE